MKPDTHHTDSGGDYVTFRVSDLLCGLNIVEVQEIKRIQTITTVHRAPQHVRGVVNMRGRIVTVIDIRRALGFATVERSPALVIIVHRGDDLIGLLVDDVDDIVHADPGHLAEPPPNLSAAEKELFCGVLKLDDTLVAVLDAHRIARRRGPSPTGA
jgi:purine-binding chemotaxis protein CheW